MRTASDLYKTLATSNAREYEVKVSINNTEYANKIIKINIQGALSSGTSDIVIGSTPCMRLSLDLIGYIKFGTKAEIKPFVRFLNGSDTPSEWLQLGVFYAENPTFENNQTSVIAYDKMNTLDKEFVSTLNYPCKVDDLLDEIMAQYNLQSSFIPSDVDLYYQPIGYTARQLLGYIASLYGGNAIFDNHGNFDVSFFRVMDTINLSNSLTQNIDNETFNLTKISCIQDSAIPITKGIGDEFHTLVYENPFVNKENINKAGTELIGLKCNNVTLTIQGKGLYYLGERLLTTDNTDKTTPIYFIVSSIDLTFDKGSFIETIGSSVRTESDTSYTKESDLQKTVNTTTKQLTEYLYGYTNQSNIVIGSDDIDIITITFSTAYSTTPVFMGFVNLDVTTGGTFNFKYYIDNILQDVTPKATLGIGYQVINLLLPLEFNANQNKTFKVLLSSDDGGVANINSYSIQSLIKGQGLVATGSKWDGTLEFETQFDITPTYNNVNATICNLGYTKLANIVDVSRKVSSVEVSITPTFNNAEANVSISYTSSLNQNEEE